MDEYKPASLFFFNPQIAFAANDRISLIAGFIFKAIDSQKLNGKILEKQRSNFDYSFGASFRLTDKANLNVLVTNRQDFNNSNEIRLIYNKKFIYINSLKFIFKNDFILIMVQYMKKVILALATSVTITTTPAIVEQVKPILSANTVELSSIFNSSQFENIQALELFNQEMKDTQGAFVPFIPVAVAFGERFFTNQFIQHKIRN